MSGHRLVYAMITGLAAVAVGCAEPRGPYSPMARADEQAPHQMREGVTMLDGEVRNSLLFINRTARRTPTGQAQVRVQMQNMYRDETLWADVRFVFYDEDKITIDETEWQTAAFPPHEVVAIKGTSLRNDVTTYNAQFKDLKSKSGRRLSPPEQILEHGLWRDSVLPE